MNLYSITGLERAGLLARRVDRRAVGTGEMDDRLGTRSTAGK